MSYKDTPMEETSLFHGDGFIVMKVSVGDIFMVKCLQPETFPDVEGQFYRMSPSRSTHRSLDLVGCYTFVSPPHPLHPSMLVLALGLAAIFDDHGSCRVRLCKHGLWVA